MKQITVTGNLLKGLVLATLLTGCQNEDLATQNAQPDITTSERNAKTGFTPQLLKEGANGRNMQKQYLQLKICPI